MIAVLKDQYELIKSSRQVALDFIEGTVGGDMNTPVPAFENKTIRYSLVHSAAIALGKRLADNTQYHPSIIRHRVYHACWDEVVRDTVRCLDEPNDLHHIETVIPLDGYKVPVWRGTPFTSLLGATFCRLSSAASS